MNLAGTVIKQTYILLNHDSVIFLQCSLCIFFQTEIIEILEDVCKLVPGNLKDQCTTYVETYGPLILMLLEQELDPNVACVFLEFCSNNTQGTIFLTELFLFFFFAE